MVRMTCALVAATAASFMVAGALAASAAGHSNGCHSAHSCPSDHHSYIWYDANGQGWSCARPGSETYDPATDTTLIYHGGLPYYCYAAGSAPPPEPAPPEDEPPAETETEKPDPLPVYVGTFGFARFGMPTQVESRKLHPFSGDDNAYFYGLRWRSWGKPKARARGKAAVNNCRPSCAGGKFIRRRGARAIAYRLRKGDCHGEPARFYTRTRMRFPKRYGIASMVLKLGRACD
jgi:hypothetical protein